MNDGMAVRMEIIAEIASKEVCPPATWTVSLISRSLVVPGPSTKGGAELSVGIGRSRSWASWSENLDSRTEYGLAVRWPLAGTGLFGSITPKASHGRTLDFCNHLVFKQMRRPTRFVVLLCLLRSKYGENGD
jgi:hypothetical protein